MTSRRPRLSVVPRSVADPAADALRGLAVALVPMLRELLDLERSGEGLVDVLDFTGSEKRGRRAALRACRQGRIEGAVKIGRRWRAPRASVESWLRSLGPRPVPPADDDEGDDLERWRRVFTAEPTRRRRAG